MIRRVLLAELAFVVLLSLAVPDSGAQTELLSQLGQGTNVDTWPVPQGFLNLENGNVHLEIPLQTLRQRNGMDMTIKLTYDSKFWYGADFDNETYWETLPSYSALQNTAFGPTGWNLRVTPSASNLNIAFQDTTVTCQQDTTTYQQEQWTQWQYIDDSGAAHLFDSSYTVRGVSGTACPDVPTWEGPANDASGYYLKVYDYDYIMIYDAHGDVVYSSNPYDPNNPYYSATYWTDKSGNRITFVGLTSSGTVPTNPVSDELGRTITLPAGYSFQTTTIPVSTNFGLPASQETSTNIQVLTGVTLPDGRSYSFTYDGGSSPGHYGTMTGMTLPTGAVISFQQSVVDVPGTMTGPLGLTQMTTPDGTWNFSYAASPYQVTITDPPLNQIQNQETYIENCPNGTYPCTVTLSYYNGPASGTPLRSLSKQIDQYQRPQSVTTTLDNGQSYYSVLQYSDIPWPSNTSAGQAGYTYTGNFISNRTDYDFAGNVLRQITVNYQRAASYTDAHIADLPLTVSTSQSQTNYSYDGSGLSTQSGFNNNSVVGATGHDDADYGTSDVYRGNLTGVSQLVNSQVVTTQTNSYNILGEVIQSVDARGNATNYDYTDKWASGTSSAVGGATFAYRTSTQSALSQLSQSTWNGTDGSLYSTQDPNDLANSRPGTVYAYDGMQRVTGTSYPDGGQTSIDYGGSAVPEIITTTVKMTATQSKSTSGTLDGLGRVIHENVSDPEGADITDTAYDSLGLVSSTSNPYRTTGDATCGTTSYVHDPLGRTKSKTNPDGTVQTWNYSGNCVDFYDETQRHWRRCSDALNRLTQVLEPDSNDSPTIETDYQYDVLGDLTRVDQWGGPSGSAGDRVRTFSYDSAGRLISATNPESGTTAYSYLSSGALCSGDITLPCSQTNANNVTINYAYDSLNRRSSKTSPSWTWYYTYDLLSVGAFQAANPIGRLVEASNNVNASEQYSYDPVGRVAYQANCIPSSCSQTGNEFQALYDFAGDLTQLTYPDGRVVKYTYDNAGNLGTVSYDNWNGQSVGYNYVSAASYWADGSPKSLTFGNGSVRSETPTDRLQPSELSLQISAPGVNEKVFDKQFRYTSSSCQGANNGNIMQILDPLNGNNSQAFCYDSLNRIASFTNGDGNMQQTFGIDAWGNVAQYGTESSVVTFGTNNQIATNGYGYDAAGDLTSYNNGVTTLTYTFDPEGRLLTANNGSASYTYDPEGGRARKDSGGDWTEYVYFGGQPYSEKNSDGSWSDYIYANGRRIARADSYDTRLHFTGTNCSNCGNQYSAWILQFSGYVVKSGDRVSWRQYQTGQAQGGLALAFTDGSITNWYTYDTNGQVMNSDTNHYEWDLRTVDLSPFAGKTVSSSWINNDVGGGPGEWDEYFGDIAIYSTDGTVTPIYYRQKSIGVSYSGSAGVTNTGFNIDMSNSSGDSELPLYTTTYYAADQIGSTRILTSGGGWPVSSDSFYPFGQEQYALSDPNHYKFTGNERDFETGYDYFRARHYSASMGRFMSPDPSGLAYAEITNPQSFNLYSYVYNNPLINIDPSGMECVWDDGSYDAADDPNTGSADQCAGQGGTWVNPDLFENAMLNKMQWTSNYGDWSGQANADLAANWVVATDVTGSASDIPLSDSFRFVGISRDELISELQGVGFAPHTLDDLLGATGAGHRGRNLRDSNATCSIHITIDPGSGQYGRPVTGTWHIDEFNPFTFPSVPPLGPFQGTALHATQDVIPDIVHDKNIDRSVIPGNRTCPHHGGD